MSIKRFRKLNMHKYCKSMFLFLLFALFYGLFSSMFNGRTNDQQINYTSISRQRMFDDMPSDADLEGYLNSLQRMIDFSAANKNDIDINYAFGLFLMNVNLKTVLRKLHGNIPTMMQLRIRHLVRKNSTLLKFFRHMVKISNHRGKEVISLFFNDIIWVERMEMYNPSSLKINMTVSRLRQQELMDKTWGEYLEDIFDWWKKMIPNPELSNHCLFNVRESSGEDIKSEPICVVPKECYNVIAKGSDYGYFLTHRLMMLILARYGRGCSIFSSRIDREMTTQLCTAAYAEANYIAMHGYGVIDLLMEQIIFCSIEGHEYFLKGPWLSTALNHQTSSGCFSIKENQQWAGKNKKKILSPSYSKPSSSKPWILAKTPDEQTMDGGSCNGHFTATAAAALSSAVRFIALTN